MRLMSLADGQSFLVDWDECLGGSWRKCLDEMGRNLVYLLEGICLTYSE